LVLSIQRTGRVQLIYLAGRKIPNNITRLVEIIYSE